MYFFRVPHYKFIRSETMNGCCIMSTENEFGTIKAQKQVEGVVDSKYFVANSTVSFQPRGGRRGGNKKMVVEVVGYSHRN